MCPRQHLDLAADRPDVREAAAVDAPPLVDDGLAYDVSRQSVEDVADLLGPLRRAVGHGADDVLACGVERRVPVLLHGGRERRAQLRKRELPDLLLERAVGLRLGDRALRLTDLALQLFLEGDQGLQRLVRGEQRLEKDLIRQHAGAALDHHDGVAAAGDDQVEIALGELAGHRIHDEASADAAHADGGDGTEPGNVGEDERGGCPDDRKDVGIVFLVVRQHGGDDLRLAPEAFRKQRPDGTVDQARSEDLFFRRPALALEEAAGDLTGREGLLLVVAGERKEIDSLARGRTGGGRDQHDGLAELHERRAARLLGHAPCFDGQRPTVKVDLYSLIARTRHAVISLRRRPHFSIRRAGQGDGALLADAEALDHALVTLEIALLEVVEQSPALPHHLEQPTAGMMVLAVYLEMPRQVPDAAREQRDLDLR